MKIVLAGASGFIGTKLINELCGDGHKLSLLTRDPVAASRKFGPEVVCIQWDAATVGPWAEYLGHADAVINLAGESLAARRWNEAQKKRLWTSRIDSTRALVDAMKLQTRRPSVLMNASAVGYYGNIPDGDVDESHSASDDFLGRLSQAWEDEARKAESIGVRVMLPRIGIVLGDGGGALEKMVLPFRFFVGGHLGSGRQWMPWIHMDDVVGAMRFLLELKEGGAFNVTAPNPVDMKTFAVDLGRVLNRPSWAPVPGFALRVIVGEFAQSLLGGQRAVPSRLIAAGFKHRFPDLLPALKSLLK